MGEVDPVTGEETLATFTKYDQRAQEGVYSDIGYVPVNNFYKLPTYEDGVAFSQPNLLYYQTRWCKHVYAAMWSIVHDEGNITIDIDATYSQSVVQTLPSMHQIMGLNQYKYKS